VTATTNRKQKIAILGGGVGAMSAAFALTDRPGWQDDHEITVYQMGWRLGGKGASGRNHALGERIEEHGLHTWMGFYDNAFQVMQKCYQELARPAGTPLATWEDAFKKHSLVTIMEQVDGRWIPWAINAPTDDDVPGQDGNHSTPWGYVRLVLEWMVQALEKEARPAATAEVRGAVGWVQRLLQHAVTFGKDVWTHLHEAHQLVYSLHEDPGQHRPEDHDTLLGLLDQFWQAPVRATPEEMQQSNEVRRLWITLELGGAIVRGLIADRVIHHGFDCIDQYDYTEWLQRHGARDRRIWWSAPIRAIYDLVFGFDNGDTARPNLAAGTALRGSLRMFFGYKGAIFWKMQAGMGDTVFTPFYEVLKRRGVRFEFFQRVANLGLAADRRSIDHIELSVQATVKPDVLQTGQGYQPLTTVQGLACWPSDPMYDQLVEGEELRQRGIDLESAWAPWPGVAQRTLRRGEDFDLVVLGISIGALPYICPELIAANDAWRDMVAHVKSVQTQSFQIWLNQDAQKLGRQPRERIMATAYVEPLDTWADMSQLIVREDWPAEAGVANITYFCGPMQDAEQIPPPFTDPAFPGKQTLRVHDRALQAVQTEMQTVFPWGTQPANPQALRWDLLVDPSNGQGEARFERQFWRANIDPSERYVQSVKGSNRYRLRAGQSQFANLYLAGDWVATGLNAGCVEAAVMAGLEASRAICGHPQTIIGESDL
jgi:uncharacterized protein with NAD-binding domain and iron-sulfur cluster